MNMDRGAEIYASLINNITAHFARINPRLAQMTLDETVKWLNMAGVKTALDRGALTITKAEEKDRKTIYDALLMYVEIFERQYGVNEVWIPLKIVIVRYLQGLRDEVRMLGLEIPLGRYSIDYSLLDNLFGFNASDFRVRKWTKDPITVTNQRLIFRKSDAVEAIPLSSVATVDREIYIGYSSEQAKGVIRAIDYQTRATGMSCIVLLAPKNIMADFMRLVTIMRGEYKRLADEEAKVLIAVYNGTASGEIARALGLASEAANKAFRRLQDVGYVDDAGHITAYGINASMEILQSAGGKEVR
jgi:hypothetical protein